MHFHSGFLEFSLQSLRGSFYSHTKFWAFYQLIVFSFCLEANSSDIQRVLGEILFKIFCFIFGFAINLLIFFSIQPKRTHAWYNEYKPLYISISYFP